MRRDKVSNILRVVKFLEENPDTYLREISRNLNLNPATVHRCLKEISEFIVAKPLADTMDGLPNLPVLIRLKEGVTAEGIARFLKFKKKLGKL